MTFRRVPGDAHRGRVVAFHLVYSGSGATLNDPSGRRLRPRGSLITTGFQDGRGPLLLAAGGGGSLEGRELRGRDLHLARGNALALLGHLVELDERLRGAESHISTEGRVVCKTKKMVDLGAEW